MGAYYLVVNPAKRQYLDPARFGEAIKFQGVLEGGHCIRALKLLIVDNAAYPCSANFQSAWFGDPVILASDDSGPPNPSGITTATPDRPGRNLNQMARDEFTDISYRAIAELCLHDNDILREMIEEAKDDSGFFIDLANVRLQYRFPALEYAFLEAFGNSWRKKYDQTARECHWWQPLPPIDWPL
ncbi:MAG TPA: hypothetical protein VE999_12900 [Gemmataceae bacterium]|nr:hypothetical protein [Gemmataceae bacterium]